MCECGCTMNDEKLTFPGPGKSFYILSLAAECKSCDAPPGITIELIEPGNVLWDEYKRGEFVDGPLQFEKWRDSKGVAIVTGMRQHEFVKATISNLMGLEIEDFCEGGKIDESGAEVILEEMYDDSQVKPHVIGAKKPAVDGTGKLCTKTSHK